MNYKKAIDILNIDENYNHDILKKKYKKLLLKYHPDKGGDSEKFIELNEAYTYLLQYENRMENKDVLFDIYIYLKNLLEKYKIENPRIEKIIRYIKEIIQPEDVIILRPTLKQMMNAEIYILEYENKKYYIPLWESEVIYKQKNKNIVIRCIPKLNDNIDIDENNNIIIKDPNNTIIIGEKVFDIPNRKNRQTIILYNEGIPKCQSINLNHIVFSDIYVI